MKKRISGLVWGLETLFSGCDFANIEANNNSIIDNNEMLMAIDYVYEGRINTLPAIEALVDWKLK